MKMQLGFMMAAMLGFSSVATAGTADKSVEKALKSLHLKYEVDGDGDFRLIFDVGDGRTQLGWVRSSTNTLGAFTVREIWSPGYQGDSADFPAAIANSLLAASNDVKLGAWVKQGRTAMFIIKIPAKASKQQLHDAIVAAFRTADAMEKKLLGTDEL